ncbi:MAG: SirB1 family protein [Prochloraceae cyanobacterium]
MDFPLGWQKFYQEIDRPDEQINLAKAALYYAQVEYPDLDPEEYLNALDTMAEEIKELLPATPYPLKVIKTINQYLFDDLGFQGNTSDYYNPSNSFLNEVIDRRTGIPLTLSVVYLEIAQRLDFPMVGIGMPGHFLIRPNFEDAAIFVDAFNCGEVLFEQDCEDKLSEIYQQTVKLDKRFLAPVSNRQILARMLTNLKYIYINRQQFTRALATIEGILMLFPQNPKELRDRGLVHYQLSEWKKASQDLEFYLAILPNAKDGNVIRQLLEKMK